MIGVSNEHRNQARVFLVHGHDERALLQAREYLDSLGLIPIVLREQPKGGRTIIEASRR